MNKLRLASPLLICRVNSARIYQYFVDNSMYSPYQDCPPPGTARQIFPKVKSCKMQKPQTPSPVINIILAELPLGGADCYSQTPVPNSESSKPLPQNTHFSFHPSLMVINNLELPSLFRTALPFQIQEDTVWASV